MSKSSLKSTELSKSEPHIDRKREKLAGSAKFLVDSPTIPAAKRFLILGSDLYLSLQVQCGGSSDALAKLRFKHGLVIPVDELSSYETQIARLPIEAIANLTIVYNLADEESRKLATGVLMDLQKRCARMGVPAKHITFIDLNSRRHEVLVQLATPELLTVAHHCQAGEETLFQPESLARLKIEDLGQDWLVAYRAAFASWLESATTLLVDLQGNAKRTLPQREFWLAAIESSRKDSPASAIFSADAVLKNKPSSKSRRLNVIGRAAQGEMFGDLTCSALDEMAISAHPGPRPPSTKIYSCRSSSRYEARSKSSRRAEIGRHATGSHK